GTDPAAPAVAGQQAPDGWCPGPPVRSDKDGRAGYRSVPADRCGPGAPERPDPTPAPLAGQRPGDGLRSEAPAALHGDHRSVPRAEEYDRRRPGEPVGDGKTRGTEPVLLWQDHRRRDGSFEATHSAAETLSSELRPGGWRSGPSDRPAQPQDSLPRPAGDG